MEKLNKQCFAYPEKELYPVHTKEAALKSCQEFKNELIAGNFIKSAKVRDFQYPEDAMEVSTAETTVIQDEDGNSVEFSKIASLEDVQSAVDTLNTHRQDFKGPFMRKVAATLYKDADSLDLQGDCMLKLARFAGLGLCEPEEMVLEFRKRGGLINMPNETGSKFYKAYRDLEAVQDKETLMKIATEMHDIMSQIDNMYKLSSHYGKEIQAPEDVCFKHGFEDLIAEAQDYLRVPSTDAILSKKALLESKDTVKAFMEEKYGEKAETDQEILEKVASLSGSGLKALLQVLD